MKTPTCSAWRAQFKQDHGCEPSLHDAWNAAFAQQGGGDAAPVEVMKAWEWLKRLDKPALYADRIHALRVWLEPQFDAVVQPEQKPPAPVVAQIRYRTVFRPAHNREGKPPSYGDFGEWEPATVSDAEAIQQRGDEDKEVRFFATPIGASPAAVQPEQKAAGAAERKAFDAWFARSSFETMGVDWTWAAWQARAALASAAPSSTAAAGGTA